MLMITSLRMHDTKLRAVEMDNQLFLNWGTVFVEQNDKGYVYNFFTKVLIKANKALIELLKLCNGQKTKEQLISIFNPDAQEGIRNTIDVLLEKRLIVERSRDESCTGRYEDADRFFLTLTHNCNLKCHFCLKSEATRANDIETADWFGIIDEIERLNDRPKVIYLSGGEPLTRKDFARIYEYIFAKKDMSVIVYTNGTMLGKDYLELFAQKPPKAVLMSIDGSCSKIHDKQRGVVGAFDRLLRATADLNALGTATEIIWQTVIDKQNLEDMENIIKLAISNGVRHIRFGVISEIGLGISNDSSLSVEALITFYKNVVEFSARYKESVTINQPIGQNPGDEVTGNAFSSCGIGSMIHYDETGKITPCYGISRDTVLQTVDETPVDIRYFFDKTTEDYAACATCGVRNICNGGCKAEIINISGNVDGCNEKKRKAIEQYIIRELNLEI